MKEQKVNKEKLKALVKKQFDQYVNNYHPYKEDYETYKDLPKSKWPENLKTLYRNIYSNCYNALRRESELEKRNFWITMAGDGNFNAELNKYGLKVRHNGSIDFIDMAKPILKRYLEEIVIPALEKTFQIKGIKVNRNISPMAYSSILNMEDVEIVNEEESTTC